MTDSHKLPTLDLPQNTTLSGNSPYLRLVAQIVGNNIEEECNSVLEFPFSEVRSRKSAMLLRHLGPR